MYFKWDYYWEVDTMGAVPLPGERTDFVSANRPAHGWEYRKLAIISLTVSQPATNILSYMAYLPANFLAVLK